MRVPKGFYWGADSASYQIEGGWDEDGKGQSIWDVFTHTPGKIIDGQNGDVACDSYHRYQEDLDILKVLGIGCYRFSISWSRILPEGHGTVNKAGLAYYDKVIDGCIARGIEPWVTLYHWDLPQALQEDGGWVNPKTAEYFREYAEIVVRHFGERVKHYFTLNEPQIAIGLGYCVGGHAPGLCLEIEEQFKAWHHLMLAHGMAVQVIRECAPHASVGVASCGIVGWIDDNPDETPQKLADFTFTSHDENGEPHHFYSNHWFLDPAVYGVYPDDPGSPWTPFAAKVSREDLKTICQPLDFIGLNIYHGVQLDPENDYEPVPDKPGAPRTAFDWPITPKALYWGPRLIYERYGLPVMISENGRSCLDHIYLDGKIHDPERIDFLERYLTEFSLAGEDGVPIIGYFHWSLTDNFEWAAGYTQRFGLVYMDYTTGERILKDSAFWYANLIRESK